MRQYTEQDLCDIKRMQELKSILQKHILNLPTITELRQSVEEKQDRVRYSTGGKNLFYRGYFCPQLSRLMAGNVSRGRLINGDSKGTMTYRYSFCKEQLLHCKRLFTKDGQSFEEFVLTPMPFEVSAIYIGSDQQNQQLSEMTICQYENNALQYFCTGSVNENNGIGYLYIEDYQYSSNELNCIVVTDDSATKLQEITKWVYRYAPNHNEWNMYPL